VLTLFHAIVLAFSVLIHGHQTVYTRMVDRVEASVVRITGYAQVLTWVDPQTAEYSCTGEVIGIHRVLTAAHCLGDQMTADGKPVKVLKKDEVADLALLEVDLNKPALVFRGYPVERFEPLTAIGYAWGWSQLTVIKEIPFLLDYQATDEMPPGYFSQGASIEGMSGGPVVDEEGFLVSINQRSVKNTSYSVNLLIIKAFLLGT